jgi:hypothetical protein
LRDNFNHPETIEKPEHLDSLVRGLATQRSQKSDLYYENDVSRVLCKDVVCFKINKLKYDTVLIAGILYNFFFPSTADTNALQGWWSVWDGCIELGCSTRTRSRVARIQSLQKTLWSSSSKEL